VNRQPSRAETQVRPVIVSRDRAPFGAAWDLAADFAVIGIFMLLLLAACSLARAVLIPIVAAGMIGMTLAPFERRAARHRVPPWLFAVLVVVSIIAILHIATLLLSGPISSWIGRASELTSIIKDQVQMLDRGFARLQSVLSSGAAPGDTGFKLDIASLIAPALEILSPAIGELIIFLGMLFFILLGQNDLRRALILAFSGEEARLAAIRILNRIEEDLAGYFAMVSLINLVLGAITAIGVYLIGIPNAVLWGVVAFLCNFLPYVGQAIVLCILFGVGLINFSSIGYALVAPAFYLTLVILEGQFITPNVLGHRFTLNPLLVFAALVFSTWLWGPIGSFLSVPILIIGLSVLDHLVWEQELELPG